jgi:hypothetical protein
MEKSAALMLRMALSLKMARIVVSLIAAMVSIKLLVVARKMIVLRARRAVRGQPHEFAVAVYGWMSHHAVLLKMPKQRALAMALVDIPVIPIIAMWAAHV